MRLEDKLEEEAASTPYPSAPADLWDRGARWGRRRRRGTAAIAVVAVLALLAVLAPSWPLVRSAPMPAAGSADGLALPDAFYAPSPWLPATDEPTGLLSAVVVAERSRWGDGLSTLRFGVAGVSAAGDYRFLDLPGMSGDLGLVDLSDDRPALSSDGRLLAYWYLGGTREAPNTRNGPAYAGVAVWDAVTGDLTRLPLPSDHGIRGDTLTWAGDRLWLSPYAKAGARSTSASSEGTVVWAPGTGEVTRFDRVTFLDRATDAGGSLLSAGPRRLLLLDAPTTPRASRPERQVYPTDRVMEGAAYASPDGTRVAALVDSDGDPASSDSAPSGLLVGDLDRAAERIELSRVGEARFSVVLGWRDEDHVVALDSRGRTVVSVDVTTGTATTVSTPDRSWGWLPQVAQDAWQAPLLADAPEPPSPPDPRLQLGLAVLLLVGAVGGAIVWRRRANP